jgi:hypothetical protein
LVHTRRRRKNKEKEEMRIRSIGILLVLCVCALLPLNANRASAQAQSAEKPILYTYVSEWTVPRAMWADYLKIEAADNDSLKKFIADGSIVSFGSYAVLNHQEGAPTHGSWFSATTMANLMKVLEAERTAPVATAPPLAAAKHWDYVLQSHSYNAHPGTFSNGYLRVGSWRPKADSSDPEGKIRKATLGALLEKLFAEGALHSYDIDEENIHTRDPGTLFIAIVANGAEGLDKFNDTLDAWEKENTAAWVGLASTLDPVGHRDFLARVGTLVQK